MTTKPLTSAELARIRDRANAATDDKWWAYESTMSESHTFAVRSPSTCIALLIDQRDISHRPGDTIWREKTSANAEFIAHSREDVPRLLAEMDRLLAREGRIRTAISEMRTGAVRVVVLQPDDPFPTTSLNWNRKIARAVNDCADQLESLLADDGDQPDGKTNNG